MSNFIAKACVSLRSEYGVSVEGNDLSKIIWSDNAVDIPTNAEIQAEADRLQDIYDSQAYARSRKQEYDKLNQFEMQFDDNRDGTSTWVDSILAIKDKFPKP